MAPVSLWWKPPPSNRTAEFHPLTWESGARRAYSRLQTIAAFVKQQGAVPGIQLAHADAKPVSSPPWVNRGAQLPIGQGGWKTIAPSAIPFHETDLAPLAMTKAHIETLVEQFRLAARRALAAGFEVLELHGAHGYLINEFLSPLTNHRQDEYGGSFENRLRLLKEIITAVRSEWPDHLPLFVRISATDWVDGGWNGDDSVQLARAVKLLGVDLIDCSSGATVPYAKIPVAPGFQVPFAEQVRREADILTGAVGLITEPAQANELISSGKADLVLLARQMLRDPYWPLHAAKALGIEQKPPVQYERAL